MALLWVWNAHFYFYKLARKSVISYITTIQPLPLSGKNLLNSDSDFDHLNIWKRGSRKRIRPSITLLIFYKKFSVS